MAWLKALNAPYVGVSKIGGFEKGHLWPDWFEEDFRLSLRGARREERIGWIYKLTLLDLEDYHKGLLLRKS